MIQDELGITLRPYCRIQNENVEEIKSDNVYFRIQDILDHIQKSADNKDDNEFWDETLWGATALKEKLVDFNEVMQISAKPENQRSNPINMPDFQIRFVNRDYHPQVDNICEAIIISPDPDLNTRISFMPSNMELAKSIEIYSPLELVEINGWMEEGDEYICRYYRKNEVIDRMIKDQWTGYMVGQDVQYISPNGTPTDQMKKLLNTLQPIKIPYQDKKSKKTSNIHLDDYLEKSQNPNYFCNEESIILGAGGEIFWYDIPHDKIPIFPGNCEEIQKNEKENAFKNFA